MAIIYDADFPRKVALLLQTRGGKSLNELLPDTITPVIDLTSLLENLDLLPQTPTPVLPPGGTLEISTGEYFVHAGSRTSPAGGAGQFSGLGVTYEANALTSGLTRIELVYLRAIPSVATYFRIYYETVDVFGTGAQGRNFTDGTLSARARFVDWTAQTTTPDTTNIPNHSGRTTLAGAGSYPTLSAGIFEWNLAGRIPWILRVQTSLQSEACGWGGWAQASVTAISIDYVAIYRQVPTP